MQIIRRGLSSIYWREAWKYGERAFRYCHHDIGHAICSISIAAAELGWQARLIENVGYLFTPPSTQIEAVSALALNPSHQNGTGSIDNGNQYAITNLSLHMIMLTQARSDISYFSPQYISQSCLQSSHLKTRGKEDGWRAHYLR